MMKVLVIYGQGGPVFSLGFRAFGNRLKELHYDVSFWWPNDLQGIVNYIQSLPKSEKIALLGYSLGGNCISWTANALPKRDFELVVAYDPTVNTVMNPLGANVKRAISYQQTSYFGTSLLFGRAVLLQGPGGPKIEIYKVQEDHLSVQSNSGLHNLTIQALGQIRL